jgi:hypothetical protein
MDKVHQQIAPHANHQQRTESGVKGIADQLRSKDHRNACEHNKSAKEIKQVVKWMQCAENTANYLDSTTDLIKPIQKAEAWFGKANCNEVLNQFSCWQLTQGEREQAKKVATFSVNLKSISFVVTSKAEHPQAIKITCQMGGDIYLSVLTAKNGTQPHIQAELEAHDWKPRKLGEKSIKELRELLKEDELKHRVIEMQQVGLKVSSI